MILDRDDNKTTAYKKAKEIMLDTLEKAFYFSDFDPTLKNLSEKENDELIRHLTTLYDRLAKKL
jgi:chromosome condensin MukBEF MukE localization factor